MDKYGLLHPGSVLLKWSFIFSSMTIRMQFPLSYHLLILSITLSNKIRITIMDIKSTNGRVNARLHE